MICNGHLIMVMNHVVTAIRIDGKIMAGSEFGTKISECVYKVHDAFGNGAKAVAGGIKRFLSG